MGTLSSLWCAGIAVHLLLWWSCGSAQRPGFLSIDCGASAPRTDDTTGIQWASDAAADGEVVLVEGLSAPLDTTRVFTGDHSKYCYRLSNSAVTAGAFFLVRAWLSMGAFPRYPPKSSDGSFRFKLLIDADEWRDVSLANGTVSQWLSYEAYIRALQDSIHICVARATLDGDHPFISAIELRPLPDSLSATRVMSTINLNFISVFHDDSGASGSPTRYPFDPFDRLWQSDPADSNRSTINVIDTSEDQNQPPSKILQTAVSPGTRGYTTWTYSNRPSDSVYYCVLYFAEIGSEVNATGQRVFDVVQNGTRTSTIDLFKEVGAFTSYSITIGPLRTDEEGDIAFNVSATSTSLFPPLLAATELFRAASKPFSMGTSSNDVMAIEDLKSNMNLSSYTGDPCLPVDFGYSWLTCINNATAMEGSRIKNISLSNHLTGGKIPESIQSLNTLETILLDGNNLEGSIPDMSSLVNLQILDLSNNKLNGSIPESLATLNNLKVLNLANNTLTGEIPTGLLQRQQASELDFRFSGNIFCENRSEVLCTFAPPSSSSKSQLNVGLVVGVALAVFFVVMIGATLAFFLCKNKIYHTLKKPLGDVATQNEMCLNPSSKSISNQDIEGPLPILSIQDLTFEEIKICTNNFETIIGKGGFGPVYKGHLKNGTNVAVKVCSESSQQGFREFINEVDVLSRIHHKNLVDLHGFCKEGVLILVYEYMSEGSLSDCIHGEIARKSPLSWSKRLSILVGAAQGLDYLHNGCHPRIIHRDIKSSNVLLNDKLEAKISDFGISRSSFFGDTTAPSTKLMGSMGYIDPEYLLKMRLTEKIDIYSFGVLILEVICGKKPIHFNASHKEIHILEWVRPYVDQGMIENIVDASLNGDYNLSSVWKALEVALACVEPSSDQRPNMSNVYLELKEAQTINLNQDSDDIANALLGTSISGESGHDFLSLTHVQSR